MKRIICFLLLTLMLLGTFVACAKENPNDTATTPSPDVSTTPADTTSAVTTLPVDEDGYILDRLPSDLTFSDGVCNILYWKDAGYEEFAMEETSGDLFENAVYKKNLAVSSRLGIKLNFIGEKGNNSNRNSFIETVTNNVTNNTKTYDLIGAYSMCAASFASHGLIMDLNETKHVDLEMPWWPDSLVSEATVNGKLYFASGDISTNLLWSVLLMIYNKDLLKTLNIQDNLYDLVNNGEWTLDKLEELCKNVYFENDGIEGKSAGDRYGFATSNVYCDALFFASGLKTVENNSDGTLKISPTFGSERTQSLITRLVTFFNSNDANFNTTDFSKVSYFNENKTLFELRPTFYIRGTVADSNVDYGVLPVPKYDKEQSDYVSTVGFTYSLYCIPKDTDKVDMASAVLECLASEAYRKTTPALFEVALKVRYSKTEKASQMFDIIRENVSFDLGRIFCLDFNSKTKYATYNLFRYILVDKSTDWMSRYAADETTLNADLDKLWNALK